MSTITVVIQSNKNASDYKKPGQRHQNLNRVKSLIDGVLGGAIVSGCQIYGDAADPVKASGTATAVSVIATNTLTIAGTVLTASATPASESQFLSTGTDSVVAAAIAAAINVHSVLSKLVSATVAANVVTVSCVVPGPIGNLVSLASSGATLAVSGAVLAGGLGGVSNAPEVIR